MSKWLSRKLLVFIIASVALFTHFLDGDKWLLIAAMYTGGQFALEHKAMVARQGIDEPTTV